MTSWACSCLIILVGSSVSFSTKQWMEWRLILVSSFNISYSMFEESMMIERTGNLLHLSVSTDLWYDCDIGSSAQHPLIPGDGHSSSDIKTKEYSPHAYSWLRNSQHYSMCVDVCRAHISPRHRFSMKQDFTFYMVQSKESYVKVIKLVLKKRKKKSN